MPIRPMVAPIKKPLRFEWLGLVQTPIVSANALVIGVTAAFLELDPVGTPTAAVVGVTAATAENNPIGTPTAVVIGVTAATFREQSHTSGASHRASRGRNSSDGVNDPTADVATPVTGVRQQPQRTTQSERHRSSSLPRRRKIIQSELRPR
jgi:hypothetical protein